VIPGAGETDLADRLAYRAVCQPPNHEQTSAQIRVGSSPRSEKPSMGVQIVVFSLERDDRERDPEGILVYPYAMLVLDSHS